MEKPRASYHTKWTVEKYESKSVREGECLVYPKSPRVTARTVYQLRHGTLPSSIAVCHTCDNTFCIRDEHHFVGTWKDNVNDAVKKGRHSCFKNVVKCKFTGHTHSKEARRRIAEASKQRWADPEYCKRVRSAINKGIESAKNKGVFKAASTKRWATK